VRILVGVDLDAGGHEWLIDRAAVWAGRLRGTIDLVYFRGSDAERPDQRSRLEALAGRLPAERRGAVRLEPGTPDEGLVRLTGDYDLLAMGGREPPALERLMKGHLATRVFRLAKCAVLVPRGDRPIAEPPKLLVGVDVDGPDPISVLKLAGEWAAALHGKVMALFAEATQLPHLPDRDYREAAEREWLAMRAPKIARLKALLETHVGQAQQGEVIVRRGEPDEVLVELSQQHDLVIVGNRSRPGLAGFVFGPVGGQVVRRAYCDVLVVPTAGLVAATPNPLTRE
jgi:nucleotide-binding universal stress UspA family protein